MMTSIGQRLCHNLLPSNSALIHSRSHCQLDRLRAKAPASQKYVRKREQAVWWPIERFLLLFVTLAAFAWRLHGIAQESLWRDEVDAVYFALRELPQTLSMFVSTAQNGALYFLSLRPWLQTVGSTEFALRYPSAAAGVLCVPLIWQVALKLFCPHKLANHDKSFLCRVAPLGAAALLAVNPYQLWYSQEGKMYSIIVAQALLASWLWLRGVEAGRQPGAWRYWIGYLIITSLSIYSHLLMILMIPIHFLWFLIGWPQSRRAWRGYLSALAGLTLPYLPMLWWQWDMLTASTKRTGYSFTPFTRILDVLLDNHIRGFMSEVETIWYAPIYFVALAGLLMGIWEFWSRHHTPKQAGDIATNRDSKEHASVPSLGQLRDGEKQDLSITIEPLNHKTELAGWQRYLFLISWLFGPILLIYGLSLRQPIFVDRYIIWIGPAGILLLMLGLSVVWNNASAIAKPLVFVLGLYIGIFWLFAGWEQKSLDIKYDLRGAVGTVQSNRAADDLLILQIPYMEFSYRYYSSDLGAQPFTNSDERLGHWIGGLWTNNGHPDEQARAEVAQHMANLAGGFETIWVIFSEAEMWDQRRLMDEWLDANGEQVGAWNYHGSQVRQYRMR